MRTLRLVAILVIAVLLAGCAPSNQPAASQSAPEADADTSLDADDLDAQVRTAALFTFAAHFGDSELLAKLIDPEDASAVAEEIASIDGSSVDPDDVLFEQVEGGIMASYGESKVFIMTHPAVDPPYIDAGCIGQCTEFHGYQLTLAQGPSGWIVDTSNDRPAVTEVLRMSPAGHECLRNLEAVTMAAKAYRAASAGYTVPASLDELVPEHLASLPVCPTGGTYSVDEDGVATCSRHGERSK